MNDYPSDEELQRIREWKVTTPADFNQLMEYVKDIWHWDFVEQRGGCWRLVTGGWSGNEDIIGALHANFMVWVMTWQSSHRGGLHWFAWGPEWTGPEAGDKP